MDRVPSVISAKNVINLLTCMYDYVMKVNPKKEFPDHARAILLLIKRQRMKAFSCSSGGRLEDARQQGTPEM